MSKPPTKPDVWDRVHPEPESFPVIGPVAPAVANDDGNIESGHGVAVVGPSLSARVLNRAELATLPEPEPLIDGTLDRHTVALLAGYFGTCKSFLALDFGACIATGKPWQGRAVQPGRVLYLAAEGAFGLHARLSAWEYAWGTTIDPDLFHIVPVPVNLGNRAHVRELLAVTRDLRPRFVVIDTIARCAVGLDENSARDMGLVVDSLFHIRAETDDGTLLAVHHTGKDRSTIRGSSALESACDTVYKLEGDPQSLKLERTKRKDGPRDDVLSLGLVAVDQAGSAVLEYVRTPADMAPRAQELMSAFVSAFGHTGATKSELRMASGLPPATFARSLNALVRRGILVNTGTERRPFYTAGVITHE